MSSRAGSFKRPGTSHSVEFIEPTSQRRVWVNVKRIRPTGLMVDRKTATAVGKSAIANLDALGLGQQVLRRTRASAHDAEFRFADVDVARTRQVVEWTRAAGELSAPLELEPLYRERITNPERLRKLLSFLHQTGRFDLDALPLPGTPVRVENLYSVLEFKAPVPGALPSFIDRTRRRRERRQPIDPRVMVRCQHPLFEGQSWLRSVRDVSASGLSIWACAVDDLLWPGLELPIELLAKHRDPVKLKAVVRHVTPRPPAKFDLVGMEILPTPEFRREVDRILYPGTYAGTASPGVLWSLYDESGYFRLSGKRAADFRPLFDAFCASETKLREAPQLGGHFTTHYVDATMHQLQLWDGGWLIYHVSRSQRPRGFIDVGHDALFKLYRHAYEHANRFEARWLVTYVQEVATWSRFVHRDVPAAFVESGDASVTSFYAYEVPSAVKLPDGQLTARKMKGTEAKSIESHLRSAFPRPYVEALGLDDLVASADPRGHWSAAGLRRGRAVFVAENAAGVRAVAVLDSAQTGLHLFRLADSCRIYNLGKPEPELFRALLGAAARWFADQGKERFVYFHHDDAPKVQDIVGDAAAELVDLGAAWITVLNAARMPELVERIGEFVTRAHPLLAVQPAAEEER